MIHPALARTFTAPHPCSCANCAKRAANGLGFIAMPQLSFPPLDWKIIALIAAAAFILYREFTMPKAIEAGGPKFKGRKARAVARRLDTSRW